MVSGSIRLRSAGKKAKEARNEVDTRLISALKQAADRIYSFHEAQRAGRCRPE